MSYTVTNFKTKKAFKEAVEGWNAYANGYENEHTKAPSNGKPIKCYNPGLGPDLSNFTGTVYLEGPHYPAAHTWYAQAELVNGIVVKVK